MRSTRSRPNPGDIPGFHQYVLERLDDLTKKVYVVIGGLGILGLLHFLDPIWHFGPFQFP